MSTETFAVDENQQRIENAVIDEGTGTVTVDGKTVENATVVLAGDVLGSFKQDSTVLNSDVLPGRRNWRCFPG